MAVGLNQVNNVVNSNGRWLDLIFMSESDTVNVSCSNQNLLPNEIHHKSLEINVSMEQLVVNNGQAREAGSNFYKADYAKLNRLLDGIDWELFFLNLNIDQSTDKFYDQINEFFAKSVLVKMNATNNHPKYFDKHLINLKNRTNKASKAHKVSGCESGYEAFSKLRKELKEYSHYAYRRYIEEIGEDLRQNPKLFFQYVNEKRKTNGFPSSMTFKERTCNDRTEISNLFGDFFSVCHAG